MTVRDVIRQKDKRILAQHYAEVTAVCESMRQQQPMRTSRSSVSPFCVSPEPVGNPVPDQCRGCRITNSSYKLFVAEQTKFLDEHANLAATVSDLEQAIRTSLTKDSANEHDDDEDLQAVMNKVSIDQSVVLLKALTGSCRKMACRIAMMSQEIQNNVQTNQEQRIGTEGTSLLPQSAASCGSQGKGHCIPGDDLHIISPNVPDSQQGESTSRCSSKSGGTTRPSPSSSKHNSHDFLQQIMPAEAQEPSVPTKSKWYRNPVTALGSMLQGKNSRHQALVPAAMNIEAGTNSAHHVPSTLHYEDMAAVSLPNLPTYEKSDTEDLMA